MNRVLVLLAAVALQLSPARATTAEAVNLHIGPFETGDTLSPVWMAKCPAGQRLVGVREHRDDRLINIEAICINLRNESDRLVWLGEPAVAPPPPPPPPPRIVTREVQREVQGTSLHADSAGVTRLRGSRAELITVTEQVVEEDTFPARQPTLDFDDGASTDDVLCPRNAYVRGIRVGSSDGRHGAEVAALQLICTVSTGRDGVLVGEWPTTSADTRKGKRKSRDAEPAPLQAQRIECGGMTSNPHDGAAAAALFGTADNGRIASIGVSCAQDVDPRGPARPIYTALRRAVDAVPRLLGWERTYAKPIWFDGTRLAVCQPGALDRICAQASADRYCAAAQGYDHATAYVIGSFVRDSVAATGDRCARGACRAFTAITCGFARS